MVKKTNNTGRASSAAPAAAPKAPKSRTLRIPAPAGMTMDKALTNMAAAGVAANAGTIVRFSQPEHGELSLTDMVESLREQGEAVNGGDLTAMEKMLAAQAVALNSIFAELARRAAVNMGEYLDATERYMRLALRAQGQCRAALETLAVMKNPPVFARQANIAHGPQQVNVGASAPPFATSTRAYAPARETVASNELLEDRGEQQERVDRGAAAAAGAGNHAVEALVAVNGAEDT